LHKFERRDEGEEGSGSGFYSYPASSASECAEKEVFCSEYGEDVCVRQGVCDGYATCSDGEDEADCGSFECFEGSSKMCGAEGPCVVDDYRCDGYADCGETHIDELDCPEASNCSSYEGWGQCPGENTCIHEYSMCDGNNDCLDGIDETECEGEEEYHGSGSGSGKRALAKKTNYGSGSGKRNFHGSGSGMMHYGSGSAKRNFIRKITNKRGACPAGEWQCASGDECIDITYMCEGGDYSDSPDCSDGSDEADCETKCAELPGRHWCTTIEAEFHGVTKCLELGHRCDGETVCADGSDEQDCDEYQCPEGQSKCVSDDVCTWDEVCEEKKNVGSGSGSGKRAFGSGSGSGKRAFGSGSGSGKRAFGSGSGSGKRAIGSGSGSGKRAFGNGSGSGKRAFGSGSGKRRLSTEAAEKRMLKEKLNRLLEALNED